MKVRTGGVAGGTEVARRSGRPRCGRCETAIARHVVVRGRRAVGMLHDDTQTVGPGPARGDDRPVGGRFDRGAVGRGEVEAGVLAAAPARPARTEGGRHARAGERRDVGGLRDRCRERVQAARGVGARQRPSAGASPRPPEQAGSGYGSRTQRSASHGRYGLAATVFMRLRRSGYRDVPRRPASRRRPASGKGRRRSR